jgi:hypothetical protein
LSCSPVSAQSQTKESKGGSCKPDMMALAVEET